MLFGVFVHVYGDELSAEEQARLAEVDKQLAAASNVIYKGWAAKTSAATSDLAVQQFYGLKEGLPVLPAYFAGAAAVNGGALAAASALGPLSGGAAVLSMLGEATAAAALHGNFVNSMKVEQAGLYRELLQVEGLSRKEAALLARVGGAINGYIEVGNLSTVLSLVPGMGAVGEKFASILKSKGGAKALLAVPSVRRTLLDGLKNYASGVGSETMEEIEQAAVSTIFVEATKRAKGQDGKSLEEALSDILDEGREALPHMALGMLPGAVVNTGMAARSTYHAKRTTEGAKKGSANATLSDLRLTPAEEARVNAVKELEASEAKAEGAETKAGTKAEAPAVSAVRGGNTEEVKTDAAPERNVETPQAMEAEGAAIENTSATGEGGAGDGLLFIKADTLDAYMQSLPEPERETLGQALGLHKTSTEEYLLHAKDYEKAAREHNGLNNAVAMDLRAGALGITARERTEAMEKIKALGTDPMEGDEPFAAEARAVRDDLVATFVKGGQSDELARANAELMSHFWYNFARRAAMDETGQRREGAPGPKAFYDKLRIRFAERENKKMPSSAKGEGYGQALQKGRSLYEWRLKRDEEKWGHFIDGLAQTGSGVQTRMMGTPLVFTMLKTRNGDDISRYPLFVGAGKLKKIQRDHPYMTNKVLKQIPKALADPIAVFQSAQNSSDPNGLVAMLELQVPTNRRNQQSTVIVALKFNAKKKNSALDVNFLGSTYAQADRHLAPRDKWFSQQERLGNLLYVNTQKSSAWTSSTGVQFPGIGAAQNLASSSIKTEADLVKLRKENGNRFYQSAWHGSPYRFESFDLGAIGMGEGHQAHGWGLYFAQDRKTSEHYKDMFGPDDYPAESQVIALDSQEVEKYRERYAEGTPEREGLEAVIEVFENFGGLDDGQSVEAYEATCSDVNANVEQSEREIERLKNDRDLAAERINDPESDRGGVESARERLSQITEDLAYFEKNLAIAQAEKVFAEKLFFSPSDDKNISTLYEVDIPENDVLLDEDLPLSEQPENVREAIAKYYNSRPDDYTAADKDRLGAPTGRAFLKDMTFQMRREGEEHPERAASLLLNSLGVKGITYLGERDGRCFVVFDDKAVSVIERYNQEVAGHPLVRAGLTRKPDGAQAKVVHLPENAVPQFPQIQDFNKWVKALLMDDGNPPVKILSTGQEATFTGRNIRSSLKRARSEAHREAYVALREMISLAEYDHFEPADMKHLHLRGQDVYYSALNVGDQLYSVRLKLDVSKDRADVVYKDHKLTEIEIAPALYSTEFDESQSRTQEASAISTVSLGVLRGNVKPSHLENGALWQEQLRGSVEFRGDKSLITLFKAADQSTFVHEMGHVMLENLLRLGRGDDAPPMVAKDLDVALDFLNMKDFDFDHVETEAQRKRMTDAQERFARAFERYLMEGRAPSKGLKRVFARMKRWMLSIYHNARRLDVELSPQVRDLFARLLAGPVAEEGGWMTLVDLHDDAAATKACLAELNAAGSEKLPRGERRKAFYAGKKLGVELQKGRALALKERQRDRARLKKEVDALVRGIRDAGEQKSIIWSARQEIKDVLKGYTLKNPSRQRLARAQELFDYLTDHPEARLDDYSPSDRRYIDMLGTTLLPDMTIDELRGLAARVEDIRARGRDEYRRWEAAKQLRREEKFNGCFKALGKIPDFEGKAIRSFKDLRKEYKGVEGRLEKVKDWAYADTLGAHRLMDWIGNGRGKFDSAWTKFFVEDVNSAHDEYLRCKNERHEGIEAVMRDEGIGLHDLSKSRQIDGQVYSIDEMLSVYALMKNEKGKKALLYGNFKGLPDPQGHAAHIIQALTPEQRALADAVLADYDKSFDRLNARFIEAFNEGMEKEENYSPMKRLEYTSNEGLIDAESEETLRGRSVAAGARAALDKGFLVKRMEIGEEHQQPVDLGLLSIWNDQVATQEHTAAFATLAGDLNSVLNRRDEATDASMAMAVRMTKGTEAWNSVVGYTNLVVMNETRAAHDAMTPLKVAMTAAFLPLKNTI